MESQALLALDPDELAKNLVASAFLGDLPGVEAALAAGADPNANPFLKGLNAHLDPVGACVALDHGDCLRILARFGARLQASSGHEKISALALSARTGSTNCAEALLDLGANPEERDELGRSALLIALDNGHAACALALAPRCDAAAVDARGHGVADRQRERLISSDHPMSPELAAAFSRVAAIALAQSERREMSALPAPSSIGHGSPRL